MDDHSREISGSSAAAGLRLALLGEDVFPAIFARRGGATIVRAAKRCAGAVVPFLVIGTACGAFIAAAALGAVNSAFFQRDAGPPDGSGPSRRRSAA